MEGIGPEQLRIRELMSRTDEEVRELICAQLEYRRRSYGYVPTRQLQPLASR